MESLLHRPDNYTILFSNTLNIEERFDTTAATEWMKSNWYKSIYISATYLALIYMGLKKMSTKTKWELRTPLLIWNLCMAVFSTMGALRFLPEMYFVLSTFGFRYSICNAGHLFTHSVTGFWSFLFSLSKVVELFDTFFIILRKQKLIFLHWYHHATVLILTWYFYANLTSLGRWFGCMNYSVHSVMYSYYALRAMKLKIHRFVAMFVTTIQLIQTIIGAGIITYSGISWVAQSECQVSGNVIALALLLYISNLVLFARLFCDSYLFPTNKMAKGD